MTRRHPTVFSLIILLCGFRLIDALRCYQSDMQVENCEPADLWCLKYINGTQISRGCTNVYDYCIDDDEGCYPPIYENNLKQEFCCCRDDLCNVGGQLSTISSIIIQFLIATLYCCWR
ncbi:unnamed protein product [Caenorhabditis bovis]|uniref:UPAR/Ly6 domain-containing protein n=1 Tax=Caenorhabditis bovis TaxID=2654633 RepID=A0A8S1EAT5_9PELO|nr:unnamed protein product [Caenorhabditis bovis]